MNEQFTVPQTGPEIISPPHIPDIAVQVVNYRTLPYLKRCLETLFDDIQGGPTCKVYVADNASGDDLTILQREFPQVSVHQLPKNVGYGSANNILESVSRAETKSPTVLILNPDIEFFEPRTVERLLDRLHSAPKTKVVGPKLVTSEGKRQVWDHANYPFTLRIGGRTIRPDVFPLGPWQQNDYPTEVPWVSGAVFMAERAAFVEAQGFDPNLFLYFEEVDYCYRLIKSGGAIVYDPTISVKHIGSVVTRDRKPEYFVNSLSYIADKHLSLPAAWLLKQVYRRLPRSAFF